MNVAKFKEMRKRVDPGSQKNAHKIETWNVKEKKKTKNIKTRNIKKFQKQKENSRVKQDNTY